MKKKDQGFALVESLLIILILAVVGFGGYLVWHNEHKTKAATNSNSASQAASQSTITQPTSSTQKYLTIKEWGVRMPQSDKDTFSYKFSGSSAMLISTKLAKDYGCSTGGAGSIDRFTPDEEATPDGTTAAQAAAASPESYIKIGGYYYAWTHDQAACSDTVTAAAMNQASDAAVAMFQHIAAVPQ